MFKKIISIVLAVMLVASMAVMAVYAADDSAAVGANSDSEAVGAADGDSVGADSGDDSSVGAGNKVYFEVNPSLWKNYKKITFFLVDHTTGDQIITWGSKKGNMTDEGNNIWSYDIDKLGVDLNSGVYGCNFTADWNAQTCDLIIGGPCIGDTASLTGDMVENNVDSNKTSYVVKWKNADQSKYAPPMQITSIGNVIGQAYWPGDDAYSMLVNFIKSDGLDGLANAIKFNGKTEQQTIDDTAIALGLGQDDIEKAIKESGKSPAWDKSKSTAPGGSSSNGGSDGGSSNGGSSNGGSSNGGSSSGGSSSGGSSSGSSSVSSGQETTIFFVFGGVMLAAAGIIFLARKRRDY